MTPTHLGRHARPQRVRGRNTGWAPLVVALLILVPLVVGAVGYVASVLWPRWSREPLASEAPELPITVGDVLFNISPAAIRVAVQRRAGAQERVDLAFLW